MKFPNIAPEARGPLDEWHRLGCLPAKTYDFHSDPGHGWIAVQRDELATLGLLDQISHYSYMQGPLAFLEEDDDASKFFAAKRSRGEPVDTIDQYEEESFVRSLPPYAPNLPR